MEANSNNTPQSVKSGSREKCLIAKIKREKEKKKNDVCVITHTHVLTLGASSFFLSPLLLFFPFFFLNSCMSPLTASPSFVLFCLVFPVASLCSFFTLAFFLTMKETSNQPAPSKKKKRKKSICECQQRENSTCYCLLPLFHAALDLCASVVSVLEKRSFQSFVMEDCCCSSSRDEGLLFFFFQLHKKNCYFLFFFFNSACYFHERARTQRKKQNIHSHKYTQCKKKKKR